MNKWQLYEQKKKKLRQQENQGLKLTDKQYLKKICEICKKLMI